MLLETAINARIHQPIITTTHQVHPSCKCGICSEFFVFLHARYTQHLILQHYYHLPLCTLYFMRILRWIWRIPYLRAFLIFCFMYVFIHVFLFIWQCIFALFHLIFSLTTSSWNAIDVPHDVMIEIAIPILQICI